MILNSKRIFMAEADAPAGNAAPTVAPAATSPTEPQAQAATPPVDAKAIAAEVRDSLFAELRKAGVFGKQSKPKEEPSAASAAATPTANVNYRPLDRALTQTGIGAELSAVQYERLERDFAIEQPGDVTAWVKDYFPAAKTPTAQPQTPAATAAATPAQKPLNDQPVSNRGAPPPSQIPLEEADLVTMSESDRAAFIREKGVGAYVKQLNKQLKGRPVSLR